jgi:hypothetical protein
MRVRLLFAKDRAVRFVSHLDLSRAWERTLRRAGLPLRLAGEFSPRPRLVFAAPLPVGACGERELLDTYLTRNMDLAVLAGRVSGCLPEGIPLLGTRTVEDREDPLTARANLAEYRWEPRGATALGDEMPVAGQEQPDGETCAGDSPPAILEEAVRVFLASAACPVERRTRDGMATVDVRPLVSALGVTCGPDGFWAVTFRVALGASGAARPTDVISALGAGVGRAFHPETGVLVRGWLYHAGGGTGIAAGAGVDAIAGPGVAPLWYA